MRQSVVDCSGSDDVRPEPVVGRLLATVRLDRR
jgi:hypothetical protein